MLLARLDPVRVENPACPGTPDVNYLHGWVELKYAERWPPKGGPLRLDHFTKQQRVWHVRRTHAGGRSFVLLKVGETEWLLFKGEVAAARLGYAPREELYRLAAARWMRKPKPEEIKQCLAQS